MPDASAAWAPDAPAAHDEGAGTTLEVLRALASGPRTRPTLLPW
ncbi:hypothetical protein AB0F13_02790 [Streptomyces sp. NPDC026206]